MSSRVDKVVREFVRRTITENPSLKNRVVAEMVINHFADREFEAVKIRQYVANIRYAAKKQSVVSVNIPGQSETVTDAPTETTETQEQNEPSS